MCLFIAFAILDQPDTFQALLDLLGSFSGQKLTGDDVVGLGKSILKMEREFNQKAGFTRKWTGCRTTSRRRSFRPQHHLHGEGLGPGPGVQLVV